MTSERAFDLVLYGATGFVGRLAARYLSAHHDLRGRPWAIAGRTRSTLEALRDRLDGVASSPGLLVADCRDQAAVDQVASQARVLLNMAGPFALYGSPVVDACVRAQTHYADITGETTWVRGLIDRHHDQAAAAGTRIIPCCGFDSVPSDLGALLLARHMQNALGSACREARAYFQMYGGFNGGTFASRFNLQESDQAERAADPFLLTPQASPSPDELARERDPCRVSYDVRAAAWIGPFFMGQTNTRVVRRSAALSERWGEPYGPDFRYQEYLKYDPPLARMKAMLVTQGLRAFDAALGNRGCRSLLKRVLPKPGQGPSLEVMNEGWFTCEIVGVAASGVEARSRWRFPGDPSNRATVCFACESALALTCEAAFLPGGPGRGGLLTPATGLGEVLAARLRRAGVGIEIGA